MEGRPRRLPSAWQDDRKCLKRLRRWLERNGHRSFRSEWAQVVECHKTGWTPCQHHRPFRRARGNAQHGQRPTSREWPIQTWGRLLGGDLLEHATACGWGVHSSAEQVRNTGEMTNYLTTIAKHGHEHAHELAKLTQLPHNAPRHFRRLRSGKGFLPPVRKNKEWTGALVRRYYDPQLGYTAQALKGNGQPPAARLEQLRICEQIEEQLFIDELVRDAQQRRARDGPRIDGGVPPVTRWRGLRRWETADAPPESEFPCLDTTSEFRVVSLAIESSGSSSVSAGYDIYGGDRIAALGPERTHSLSSLNFEGVPGSTTSG